MDQIVLLAFFMIVAVFYFLNIFYQDKKKNEYHDEQWKEIKLKAKSVSMSYLEIVTIILVMLFAVLPSVLSISIKISVERLSLITFNLVMLKSMVEYFALRHFDKQS
jgi:Na+/H+ antiporter NhaD/arsenite permease-like protein